MLLLKLIICDLIGVTLSKRTWSICEWITWQGIVKVRHLNTITYHNIDANSILFNSQIIITWLHFMETVFFSTSLVKGELELFQYYGNWTNFQNSCPTSPKSSWKAKILMFPIRKKGGDIWENTTFFCVDQINYMQLDLSIKLLKRFC